MATVLRQLSKYPKNWKFIPVGARHFARAITGDCVTALNEDTLTGRILLYMDNNKAAEDVNIDKVGLVTLLNSQPAHIRTFDIYQVTRALETLNDRAVIQNKYEFNKLLQIIDSECCNRLDHLNMNDNFNLLHTFTTVIPQQITRCQYFNLALESLMQKIGQLKKDQLIQLIFFIGLLKKSSHAQNKIRQCLKLLDKTLIDSLTKEDLCILCNSTFKTSTKIRKKLILDKVKMYINDNLYLLNDPALFVTLIKTLRHNRHQDDDILNTITCTIFFNKTFQHYPFGATCHILALYADYLYYEESLLDLFTQNCLQQLKKSTFKSTHAHLNEQPRTKDIKRFLWALSNLNYKLGKKDIESIIIPQIMVRIKAGEFIDDPGSLVQMILYLWMMQYKAYSLISGFLTKEVAQFVRVKNLPSQDSLNLLLTCIYYEDPELYQSLKIYPETGANYNIKLQLDKRPTLKQIVDNLAAVSVENDIDKYQVSCQVPYINIIGITGFQKNVYKMVNIEVLDEYTCLKNTDNVPTGLMQLKLRILDKCDEGLVVVDKADIIDCPERELKHMLKEEITLVC